MDSQLARTYQTDGILEQWRYLADIVFTNINNSAEEKKTVTLTDLT